MADLLVDLTSLYKRKITGVEIYGIEFYKALLKTKHRIIPIFRIENTIDDNPNSIIIPYSNRIIVENYSIPRIIRKSNADVIFFPVFPPPIIVYNSRIKIIPTIHDLAFKYYFKTLSWKAKIYLIPKYNKALQKSNKIITISETVRNQLENVSSVEIINLGNNISDQYKTECYSYNIATLDKFNLENGKYIISVSTIEPRKNLIYLFKIWEQLDKEFERYKLVLTGRYGWGNDKDLDTYILKFRDSIIFTGYVSQKELIDLYHFSGSFVLLSHYEGFGRTPLEAYSCGANVIVSDIPIFRENMNKLAVTFVTLDSLSTAINTIRKSIIEKKKNNILPDSYYNVLDKTIAENINNII